MSGIGDKLRGKANELSGKATSNTKRRTKGKGQPFRGLV